MRCCVVHLLSHVQLFATLYTATCQSSLSFTIPQSLLNFMSTELVMLSNHFILCHLLLLLPSIFPESGSFSNESSLGIGWLKHWSFSISLSNEYSGLIYFMTDWFDSQESSPALQFESISSLVLSLLYGPTLTSVHDY